MYGVEDREILVAVRCNPFSGSTPSQVVRLRIGSVVSRNRSPYGAGQGRGVSSFVDVDESVSMRVMLNGRKKDREVQAGTRGCCCKGLADDLADREW